MDIGGVIFDFDGVIIDSELWFIHRVKEYLASLGIEAGEKDLALLPGQPVPSIIKTMKRVFPLDHMTEEEVMEGFSNIYKMQTGRDDIEPMPGVEDFFAFLKERGIPDVVATSANREHIEDYMGKAGLVHRFGAVITSVDVKQGKPAPDVFLKAAEALEKMGVERERMVVIEDSYNGILAAKRAGLFVFGLKASEIVQDTSLADRECGSFKEIMQYFD